MRAAPLVLALLGIASAGPVFAQPAPRTGAPRVPSSAAPAAAGDVQVQARLDRNAVWVADRFTYTVRITCLHGVDILTSDLGKDKLRLEGPEFVGMDISRDDRGNGVTEYAIAYRLTTYRLDPTQKIDDLPVRYYVRRPGQRVEDVTPAGETQIPGAMVAVRSLLPDAQDTAVFRDARPPVPRRARFSMLQPIGTGLVIVSIVPVVLWAAALGTRLRSRAAHRSARQVHREERASIDKLRELDLASEKARREAYDQINVLVRQHLLDAAGVRAAGLTPEEVGPALQARRPGAPADLLVSLLADCDRARYAGPDALGTSEACRAAIERAEEALAALK